jgi:hypothetical protein
MLIIGWMFPREALGDFVSLEFLGIELQLFGSPTFNLVTILTELSSVTPPTVHCQPVDDFMGPNMFKKTFVGNFMFVFPCILIISTTYIFCFLNRAFR